jgi:phosphopantothenoylcysteine decarboxylase/phosphopantothenate--cysteine ligase
MPRVEEGKAKIPGTEDIVKAVVDKLTHGQDLKGLNVMVTAGPAREYLDSFRFISNPSSGKMGVAIAEAALRRGAEVTMVYGKGTAKPPAQSKVVSVTTTEEMLEAVLKTLKEDKPDVAILAAAAADYKPRERPNIKVPSKRDRWDVELVPLPKIIEHVKKVSPDIFLVGFKAEFDQTDEELITRAKKRMKEAVMDIVVANDVARDRVGFDTDTNEVFIIDKKGNVLHIPVSDKNEVADRLLSLIKEKMN